MRQGEWGDDGMKRVEGKKAGQKEGPKRDGGELRGAEWSQD